MRPERDIYNRRGTIRALSVGTEGEIKKTHQRIHLILSTLSQSAFFP